MHLKAFIESEKYTARKKCKNIFSTLFSENARKSPDRIERRENKTFEKDESKYRSNGM